MKTSRKEKEQVEDVSFSANSCGKWSKDGVQLGKFMRNLNMNEVINVKCGMWVVFHGVFK